MPLLAAAVKESLIRSTAETYAKGEIVPRLEVPTDASSCYHETGGYSKYALTYCGTNNMRYRRRSHLAFFFSSFFSFPKTQTAGFTRVVGNTGGLDDGNSGCCVLCRHWCLVPGSWICSFVLRKLRSRVLGGFPSPICVTHLIRKRSPELAL